MSLRFRVGDLARIVSARERSHLVGHICEIIQVGATSSNGFDYDYAITVCGHQNEPGSNGFTIDDPSLAPLDGDSRSDYIHADTRKLFTQKQRNPDDMPVKERVRG